MALDLLRGPATLSPSAIRTDGGTQARLRIDPATIAEYAEAMQGGAMFPPVVVYYDGSDYWLADGFHRLAAWGEAKGDAPIFAEIRQGTRRDAVLCAVGSNASHGLRRTNEDKRNAVLTLLRDDEWGKWSDREIARVAQVSREYVNRTRNSGPVTGDRSQVTYTTKHGTTATMQTDNIGKTAPARPATPARPAAPPIEEMNYQLYHGDCLDILPTLEAGSVDAVITDPPYGTTACKWDSVIPFAPMWAGIKHVIKPRGAVVLFGSQPFTSALVMSNAEWFKWADVWNKTKATGHLNAYIMPMRQHEDILIFASGRVVFNPQFTDKPQKDIRPFSGRAETSSYGKFNPAADRTVCESVSFPRSIVRFANANTGEAGLHPTQKPVALLEYLIRTYTNEGDTVLDFTMGSGTTGVAALHTGRKFIGIELDADYFQIAQARIEKAAQMAAGQFVTKAGSADDLEGLPMFGMEATE